MMRPALTHPLWTHTPAAIALAIVIGALISAGPLPTEAPVHFGPGGQPDRYGSPWEVFGLTIGLSLGFIVLSAWLDELWARQEARKTFNYFALLDEITVGAMAGQSVGYLRLLGETTITYARPAQEVLWFVIPSIAGALLLERLRPYTGRLVDPRTVDTSEFRRNLSQAVRNASGFVYSDMQNPGYVSLISLALPAVMFLSAALFAATQPVWATVMLVMLGFLFASFHGGLRTSITREHITIHLGTPGYRALRLSPREVAAVELHAYMPLKEFGGYGVRANSQMKAYFLSAGTGVLMTTRDGKKHLIGSNHPERLADVIRVVAGLAATS